MATTGQIHVEATMKSSADKIWECLGDSTTVFPKALSHDYKSIEVLQGDGKSPGSIRLIDYGEGSPLVKVSKEHIEEVKHAEKTYVYSVIEGDLLKFYKTFKATIIVVPKGEGSLLKWSCVYEKAHEEIPNPDAIKEFAMKNFKEIDEYLLNA